MGFPALVAIAARVARLIQLHSNRCNDMAQFLLFLGCLIALFCMLLADLCCSSFWLVMFDAEPVEIPADCHRAWVGQVPRNMLMLMDFVQLHAVSARL